MKNKGYTSHIKAEEAELEEALKGDQHKIDKNKNNKIDAHDFKLLRTKMNKEEVETVEEGWDDMLKSVADKKKPQPNGGSGKKQGSSYGGSKQKDEPEMQKEAKTLSPGQDDAPFDPPYSDPGKSVTTDKSGAQHTPSSRVRHLARTAMKRVNKDLKGKK
jgi:hypothetical protein